MRRESCVKAVGIAALCLVFALPACAQWNPGMEGYAQFRYEYSDSADDGDFDTRRVRIGWHDQVNDEGTEARFMIGLGDLLAGDEDDDVDLIYAWVSHPFENGWSTRLGFGEVRFGHDVPYSSSKRLPFERSRAASSFLPGVFGLGAMVSYEGENTPIQLDLQALDSMDAWHDNAVFSDAESFVARVQYPFDDSGLVGVSYMTSSIDLSGQSPADLGPDVWGFHLTRDWNRFGFRGEYFDGDWANLGDDTASIHNADGWYAQVHYMPEESAATPFYRYDEFNYSANMTTAQGTGGEAEYSRHTLGVAYEPWANNRLTLQVEDIDMDTDDDTTVGVQWQVIYK